MQRVDCPVGVEMELPASPRPRATPTLAARARKRPVAVPSMPSKITAKVVRDLRSRSGLTVAGFARRLGVSVTSVAKWESAQGVLRVQARTRAALEREWKRAGATSL